MSSNESVSPLLELRIKTEMEDTDEEENEHDDDDKEEQGYETRSEVASSNAYDSANEEPRASGKFERQDVQASNTNKRSYLLKLNYLFREARFFLMKSNNEENIAIAKAKNVWSTLPINRTKLQQAFHTSQNVILIFSARGSGRFSGFARLSSGINRNLPPVNWSLPPEFKTDLFTRLFELDWVCRKELPFNSITHLRNAWNSNKPIKIGRDGQEIEPRAGEDLCRQFPIDENVDLTEILRKSRDGQKLKLVSYNHFDKSPNYKQGFKQKFLRNQNILLRREETTYYKPYLVHRQPIPFIPTAGSMLMPRFPRIPPYIPPPGPPRYYEPLSMLPEYSGKSSTFNNYLSYTFGSHSVLQKTRDNSNNQFKRRSRSKDRDLFTRRNTTRRKHSSCSSPVRSRRR